MGLASEEGLIGPKINTVDVDSGELTTTNLLRSSTGLSTGSGVKPPLDKLTKAIPSKGNLNPINLEEKKPSVLDSIENSRIVVDADRMAKEFAALPDSAQTVLGAVVSDDPTEKAKLDKLKGELITSSGLINKKTGKRDLTEDILNGVYGEGGKRPSSNCNALKGFGGNRDLGAMFLLNLMLLAKMFECGFKNHVNNLMDTIDSPVVKQALALTGIGTLFKDNDDILSSKLDKGSKVAIDLNSDNPLESTRGIFKETSSKGEGRRNNTLISYFSNDLSKTPMTKEQLGKVNQSPSQSNESPRSNFGAVWNEFGVRENSSAPINNTSSEGGISLTALEDLITYTEPRIVTEAYPDICVWILQSYRYPNGDTNINIEYNRIKNILDSLNSNWDKYNRDGTYITTLACFNHASKDSLIVFMLATDSIYEVETLIGKSYIRNNVIKKLERDLHPFKQQNK